jgi:hypothetical protein
MYGRAPGRQLAVQRSRLRESAWKAIQKHSSCRICVLEPLHDHFHYKFVRDEVAPVHVGLGREPQLGAAPPMLA